MPLRTEIRPAAGLPEAVSRQMLSLLRRYFANVRPETFFSDLAGKDRVILLYDDHGRLTGFTTLAYIPLTVDGRDCLFLFSGDTIVDRGVRSRSPLAGAFGRILVEMIDENPSRACYWFLISKGYRTYRFLPVFFRRYHPSPDRPGDPEIRETLDAAAVHKFGAAYGREHGIIQWNGGRERLRPCHCSVGGRGSRDPHVAFFLRKNPGWREGAELACIAEVSRENLNRKAWRVIGRSQGGGIDGPAG